MNISGIIFHLSQDIWIFFIGPYYVKMGIILVTSLLTIVTLYQTNTNLSGSMVTIFLLNLPTLVSEANWERQLCVD